MSLKCLGIVFLATCPEVISAWILYFQSFDTTLTSHKLFESARLEKRSIKSERCFNPSLAKIHINDEKILGHTASNTSTTSTTTDIETNETLTTGSIDQ